MKKSLSSFNRTLGLVLVLGLAFAFAGPKTFTGFIEVMEEDDEGTPVKVALAVLEGESPDGEPQYATYGIANSGKGKELLDYIGETVTLTGSVQKNAGGEQSITVTKYSVVKEPEEDLEEE